MVFKYILLKLASRCNIKCSYCYWFMDDDVLKKPPIITEKVIDQFLIRFEAHIDKHGLKDFFILFHGGEPLLIGKKRFISFVERLRILEEKKTDFKLKLAVTTNGMLIDDEWAKILKFLGVGVTISIDGAKETNDKHRVDFKGNGTFDRVIKGVLNLRNNGLEPGFLAVYNEQMKAEKIINFFKNEIKSKHYDVLIPDTNHDRRVPKIIDFYKEIFDLWYSQDDEKPFSIRILESISKGLLGIESNSESIGYGINSTFTLLTDGSLEPLDVLRTAGTGFTKTNYNIFDHSLEDIQKDPLWLEVKEASTNLHSNCEDCEFKFACGGGHIGQRWSKENRFNNPTVYCSQLKEIFSHAQSKISQDLTIVQN